jgi:cytochrome c biogenesis protein CcdA/thiol-disulfide isomerase/thioredoxin
MVLLAGFALIAGAVTAVSPCVLPVLPALVSASATGGRRRPVGVVVGLAVTFFVTIIGLASLVDGVGLAEGATRTLAIAVLALFGLTLAVPALDDRLQKRLAGLSRLGPRRAGSGFVSGLGVGSALGFLYAPCAGPILAAVISVSAAQGATAEVAAIAAAYALGSATMLLMVALGGRRLLAGLRRTARGATLQRVFGVVMIATAVAMSADLDVRFQTALANEFPSVISNPTRGLERSNAVERRLARLRGSSRFDSERAARDGGSARRSSPDRPRSLLPRLGAAPELAGTRRWFNTAEGRALSLAELRGRVVLVDFWTYTCINCIRTLPYLRALDERYRSAGLTIIGVHTPEFAFERDAGNVADAIAQNRLRYPVAQDNQYATWNAFGNQFWPAKYLIDAEGQVRYTHFGEGSYGETEMAVRELLAEAGRKRPAGRARAHVELPSRGVATPETYLGYERADGFTPEPPRPGLHRYPRYRDMLVVNHFSLSGSWRIGPESATAVHGARIDAVVKARKVFLVLGSSDGRPRRVRVELDRRQLAPADAGADVRGGFATVRGYRLYRLVSLPRVAERHLTLELAPGLTAYAFTFG